MPNIEILSTFNDSQLLRAIRASNHEKIAREASKMDRNSRLSPVMAAD